MTAPRSRSVNKPTVALTVTGKILGISPWDTTLWFASDNPDSDVSAAVAGFAEGFNTAVQVFGNTWAKFNDGGTTLTGCTVRGYNAGGSGAVAQASAQAFPGIVGNATPGGAASQAIVTTLYTARPGKSGRGRLYWPATVGLSAGYQFNDPDVANLAIATANFYHALITNAGPEVQLAFVGVVRSLTLGTTNALTAVSCNTQPDRQEHRERGLQFTRHQVAY